MPHHRLIRLHSSDNSRTTYIIRWPITAPHYGQGTVFHHSITLLAAFGCRGASTGLLHPYDWEQVQWRDEVGKLGLPDRNNHRTRLPWTVGNRYRSFRRCFHRRTAGRQERKRCHEIGHRSTDWFPSGDGVQNSGLRIFCVVLRESVDIKRKRGK